MIRYSVKGTHRAALAKHNGTWCLTRALTPHSAFLTRWMPWQPLHPNVLQAPSSA